MMLLEFDLAGAEWVVVAYLSNDSNMIGVVQSGKSPHVVTGALISGAPEAFVELENKVVGLNTDPDTIGRLRQTLDIPPLSFLPRSMSIRQAGKKSNHGLNYGMKFRRAALEWEVTEGEAMPIVTAYSTVAYPGLQDYWTNTRAQLKKDRTLTNCFGRKARLLGEWGNDLFDQAYSFIPQSTVVDIGLQGMCAIYEDPDLARVRIASQTHDSLMVQHLVPAADSEWQYLEATCHKIVGYLSPELEYSGHKFRIGVDLKIGLNWGDMRSVKPIEKLREVYEGLLTSNAPVQQTSEWEAAPVLAVSAEPSLATL